MRVLLSLALLVSLTTTPLLAQEESGEAFDLIKIASPEGLQTSLDLVQKWEKKLESAKVEIDVIDTRLRDALQVVSEQIEVPIRIDQRALDDNGQDAETEVTLRTPKVAADTLLPILLKEVRLTYRIDTTGVVVTTWEAAESNLVRRVYPVSDLIHQGPQSDPGYLMEVITSTVEPSQWEQLGGPAVITHFQNNLIVDCVEKTHKKVESLLARLREVKNLSNDSYSTAALYAFPEDSKAADIEAKMNSVRVPTEFIDLPLEEVLAFLSDTSEIPIVLDKRSLAEIGISPDQPIDLAVKDLTLKQAFAVLAEQQDLSWYVVGGMIIVTTHEEAERELEIRLYPVRDLVWHGLNIRDPALRTQLWQLTRTSPDGLIKPLGRTDLKKTDLPQMPDFDNLVQTITSTLQPSSWEELGGPGSITNYPLCDCLVVQQTREVHEKLAELLYQIRSQSESVDREQLADKIKQISQDILTVRYTPYQVTGTNVDFNRDDFQSIGAQVKQLIEPDSWGDKDHFVIATQGGLIVRQERDAHEKIANFLDQVGIGLPKSIANSPSLPQASTAKEDLGGTGCSFQVPSGHQEGGFF